MSRTIWRWAGKGGGGEGGGGGLAAGGLATRLPATAAAPASHRSQARKAALLRISGSVSGLRRAARGAAPAAAGRPAAGAAPSPLGGPPPLLAAMAVLLGGAGGSQGACRLATMRSERWASAPGAGAWQRSAAAGTGSGRAGEPQGARGRRARPPGEQAAALPASWRALWRVPGRGECGAAMRRALVHARAVAARAAAALPTPAPPATLRCTLPCPPLAGMNRVCRFPAGGKQQGHKDCSRGTAASTGRPLTARARPPAAAAWAARSPARAPPGCTARTAPGAPRPRPRACCGDLGVQVGACREFRAGGRPQTTLQQPAAVAPLPHPPPTAPW